MLAIPARTWKGIKSYLTLHNRALKTCFQCRRVYLANKIFFIKSRLIVGYGLVLIGQHITVGFNSLSGFAWRPTAHTCGCELELPSTYLLSRLS